MPNQPKDVCARCCRPLALSQARWNQRYWGMAHRRCQAPAVWPPRFRPPMDPNEVMRQISALVSHLAQLTAKDALPLPQSISSPQHADETNSTPSLDLGMADSDEEDKHSEVVVTITPQKPQPTTKALPRTPLTPPSPKRAKQQSQSRTWTATTDNVNTQNETTQNVLTTPSNTREHYNLQQAVKAVGGKFVMQEEIDTQFRCSATGSQRATVDGESVCLCKWQHTRGFKQYKCRKCSRLVRRGDAGPESLACWRSYDVDDFFVCLQCLPVVIRTPVRERLSSGWGSICVPSRQ
jgi:hypothetical protein